MHSTKNFPVFIGFGANVGDRETTILHALAALKNAPQMTIHKVSNLYETEAVGHTEQDDFLNGVVEISTLLTPLELFHNLQHIEQRLGRKRYIRWGPRTIDLDILLFDGLVFESEALVIPHKELVNRRFVLQPLADLAADFCVPGCGKKVSDLLASTFDKSAIRLYRTSDAVEQKLKEV